MLPINEELSILQMIANYASLKLSVDVTLLEEYLLSKLSRIHNNYRNDLKKDYRKYLTISLRFYSLNYLRDRGWNTKINSTNLRLLAKINKWGSLKVASRRTGIPVEQLRFIKEELTNARNSYTKQIDILNIDLAKPSSHNVYSDFVNYIGGIEAVKCYGKEELKAAFNDYQLAACS